MSSQDETLRLAAEVVNKWSGPLAEFRRDLQNLGKSSKGVHAEGKKHAEEHAKAFGELKHAVHEVGERVKSGLEPAFEAFGVTAISVAGAVAAVAEAIKGFAGSSRELKFFSREVGFSINQLRELDALSKRIGSAPEAMRAGIASFAKNMEELRRHRGALNQFFASQHDVNVRRFGNDLAHVASNAEAFGRSLDFLDRIHDPVQRQNFLAALGLDPKLARLSASELREALKDIHANIGTLSDGAVKKGAAAQEAFDKLAETVEKLKEEIGSELAPTITKLTEAIATFIDKNRDGLVRTLSDLAGWIEGTDWNKFVGNLRDTAHEINQVVQQLGGWKTVAEGLILLKLGSWLVGTAGAILRVASAIRILGGAAGGVPGWLATLLMLKGDTNAAAENYGLARKLGLSEREANRSNVRGASDVDYTSLPAVVRSFGPWLAAHQPHAVGDIKEPVKEGTAEGAKKGVIEGLKEWFYADPTSYTPEGGGGGAPRAYGGGKFKFFAPRGGGAPFHTSLGGAGGETRGDRNNNPGNLKIGEFARGAGAVGADAQGHAIFPDYQTGREAMEGLLRQKYAGQSIAQIGSHYAEDPSWASGVARLFGRSPDYVPNMNDAQERSRFADAIMRQEGTHVGASRLPMAGRMAALAAGLSPEDGGVSKILAEAGHYAGSHLGPGWSAQITSGFRPGDPRFHGKHLATDWGLFFDGKQLPHYVPYGQQNLATQTYKKFAQLAYGYVLQHYPRYAHLFGWGGSFPVPQAGPHQGMRDLEHLSVAGEVGRWNEFNPQTMGPLYPKSGAAHYYRQHLLDHARRAGVLGGGGTIKGDASLRIDLNGFPRGTRTRAGASGMFKEVAINRGRAMTLASEVA